MRAYSQDLRQRVVIVADSGNHSNPEIAKMFQVSSAWVRRLIQRRREYGSIEPKKRNYKVNWKATEEICNRLKEIVNEKPNLTLAEYRNLIGKKLSVACISRTLRKLGFTYKKSHFVPVSKIALM